MNTREFRPTSSRPRRGLRYLGLCLIGLLACGHFLPRVCGAEDDPQRRLSVGAGVATTAKDATPERQEVRAGTTSRLREGSKLTDQVGEFQKSGDRISFFSKDGHGLRVLENQTLERVARILDDNPSQRVWNISGVITEYRGENYLLLTRAILKARTDAVPGLRAGSALDSSTGLDQAPRIGN